MKNLLLLTGLLLGLSTILPAQTPGDANHASTTAFVTTPDNNNTASDTKKQLIITSTNQNKIYGDEMVLGTNDFYVTGTLAAGESITSISLTSAGSAANADAGFYPIVPGDAIGTGGFLASNYDITYSDAGVLRVVPAMLIITAQASQWKIYGAPDPQFSFTVEGFKLNDDASILSGSISRDPGKNAGHYAMNKGNLNAGANYAISFIPNDFIIYPRGLILGNFSADSKEYDGTTQVNGILFKDNRLANDDLFFTYTAAFENPEVGINKTVYCESIALSGGADRYNYTLVTHTGIAYADITEKPMSYNPDDQSRSLDNEENATVVPAGKSLSADASANSLKLYPNPVYNFLIIEGAENAKIEVVDFMGKTILYTISDDNRFRIDLSELQEGFYFVRINRNSTITTQKIAVK